MKTRVSIINYSNTIPFTYGLLNSKPLQASAEFSYGYPAQVAELLCNDVVDMSIISVGAIPSIPKAVVETDFCISATKKVDSVVLCSNKPIDEVSVVTLDYQSRTTNILVRILFRYAWNISPHFVMGTEGYETKNDGSAKVIIGDRALNNASKFLYVYDLANEWYKAFHLPFVFAAWVANKKLSRDFVSDFDDACRYGVEHIDEAITFVGKQFSFDIRDYLYNSVEFVMTDAKRASMELFFEKARVMNLL